MNQIGIDYADFVKANAAGAEFAIIRKSYILRNPRTKSITLSVDPHFLRDAAGGCTNTRGDAVRFPGFNMTVDVRQFCALNVNSGWLQRRLCVIGKPYLGPLNVTGVWDNDTTNALRVFQNPRPSGFR